METTNQVETADARPWPMRTPDLHVWQIPPLDQRRRLATGAASGIAGELGIDPALVRIAFIILTLAGGWGAVLYLAAWVAMSRRAGRTAEAYEPKPKAVDTRVRHLATGMLTLGLVVLSARYGIPFLGALVWPAVFIATAIALALDPGQRQRLRNLGDLPQATLTGRIALGLALLFGGIVSASFVSLSFWQAVGGMIVAGLVLVGVGMVFAPMISNLADDLLSERRRRIRSEERADMAAHLHDSVLQTLTLIQKRSDDAQVVSLARRQERELRSWLFDDKAMNPNLGFRAGLESMMAEIEELHQVPIEVVVVGDVATDSDMLAMLQATREAAANAARHSGAPRVDVFAEVADAGIEIFVRDTGKGFEPQLIESDRAGVRDSIIGRMERHGGKATVHSTPGQGTEIELSLPRDPNQTTESTSAEATP